MANLLKAIEGTRFLIAGRKYFNISDPRNLGQVLHSNVKQVFTIFLGEHLEEDYTQAKIDAERHLVENKGLMVMPLPKEPTDIRPFEIFSKSVEKLRGNEKALIMCYHGIHNSAAYVTYHMLKEGHGYDEVFTRFRKAGWSDGSLGTVRKILIDAGIHPEKFAEQWKQRKLARMKLGGKAKFSEALKKIGEQMRKPPHRKL